MVGLMLSLTSVKDSERLNRGASTILQYNCLTGDTTYNNGEHSRAVPSTRQASSNSWLASGNYSDPEISEETCFKMTADEWVEVAELQSTQEEADTSLHAFHAAGTGSKTDIVTHSRTH